MVDVEDMEDMGGVDGARSDPTAAIVKTIPIESLPASKNHSRPIVPTVTTVPILSLNDASTASTASTSNIDSTATANIPTATIVEPITSSSATDSTDTIFSKALSHLIQTDSRFSGLIERHPCPLFTASGLCEVQNPFASLCSGVISQQVSGAAAKSIKAKFISLFSDELHDGDSFPSPEMVLRKDIPTLRTAGLSERKAEYVTAVARAFVSGQITHKLLAAGTDEEVIEALTAIRGIGKWSAEMFLMFCLRRWDVFSTGDLGIARGMAAFAGRDVAKLKKGKGKWKYMPEKEMIQMAEPYRPYRSLFCWYMWRVEGTEVEAMSGGGAAGVVDSEMGDGEGKMEVDDADLEKKKAKGEKPASKNTTRKKATGKGK
ncbi:DNA glycosylase [Pyronema omphalodes]|nr:DNA glycosylase [Pyronema omphalodes]